MFKNYFKGIEGIANYPVLLLIIFFVFFTGLLVYLWKSDRHKWEVLGAMPLDGTADMTNETATSNTIGA